MTCEHCGVRAVEEHYTFCPEYTAQLEAQVEELEEENDRLRAELTKHQLRWEGVSVMQTFIEPTEQVVLEEPLREDVLDDWHFFFGQNEVYTPGCDCGHDGMGLKWHFNCYWKNTRTL